MWTVYDAASQPATPVAMATRGDDVIGFTRIFVMFVTLVLLPALFMSGFGVIAIVNVRQVDQQRRREAAEAVLRAAEQRFVERLEAGDRAVREGLDAGRPPADVIAAARLAGAPVGAWLVLDADGAIVDGTPPLTTAAAAELTRLALAGSRLRGAHVDVDVPGFSGVVSLQRLGAGRTIAYDIDEAALRRALEGIDEEMVATLRVERPSEEPVANALERVMTELADEASGLEALVVRRLDVPFSRFTFVVEAPPSSSTTTIMVIYIVALAVFLATLITGVVLTGRLIYQETRLSRLKTDFVSHMSHELRTPLTSIRLFIETLKLGRATSPEEQQECLDLLAKETERLSEMIERVLGYARLKAGRRVFQQRVVPVDAIVQDAIDAFRAQTLNQTREEGRVDGPRLAFTTELSADLPDICVDREAIVEALLNLISNAWKYTGPDKRIVVFAKKGRRKRVVVGVRDNGPGLPKSEHARIFERFYQTQHLLSGKQPGSGLGLAITKAIVEGQGGRISVESEPGRGSTFAFDFPAVSAEASRALAAELPGAS
jgi:two-component system phosphate regulon sensor histidine kinase PhoR